MPRGRRLRRGPLQVGNGPAPWLAALFPVAGLLLLAAESFAAQAPGDSRNLEPLAREASVDFTSARSLMQLRETLGDNTDLALQAIANGLAPGSGMIFDGDRRRGLTYGAIGAGLLAAALVAHHQPRGESFRNNCLLLYQNVSFLSAWDGYYRGLARRSEAARRALGERPGLRTYLGAPFRRAGVFSWETTVPLSVALGAGAADLSENAPGQGPPAGSAVGVEALFLLQTTLVGAGEELLFRGVVLPELRSWVGSEGKAWIAQALAFGLGHVDPESSTRDNLAHMGFATTFGLYSGWVALHRSDGIRKMIALHTWWDFVVLSADYLEDGLADPIVVRLQF